MSDRERRVKDEAYRIWDEAGRPEGKGDEHWYEAEKRVAAGEGEPAPKGKKPKAMQPVVQSAGASGVVTPVAAANDAPKARPSKGAAVDIAPAKPKKAAAEKPAKGKAEKDKPAKAAKPKSKG